MEDGDAQPVADIQGVSYPKQVVTDNLALRFTPPRRQDLFSIGLLHCNVGGIEGHDNYAPCTIDDLSRVGLDYWALGHVHTRRTLSGSAPVVVYPGNIQGRDPGEPGARGCLIVDVGADGSVATQFRALDIVRWKSQDVPITDLSGIDALYDRICTTVEAVRAEADGRDVVCRLTLTGRGPMHAELDRAGSIEGLRKDLPDEMSTTSPWPNLPSKVVC